MPETVRHQIPYPLGSDPPLGPAEMQALSNRVDEKLPYVSTTEPPHVAGLIWYDPQSLLTQVSDGTSWHTVVPSGIPKGFVAYSGIVSDTGSRTSTSFASAVTLASVTVPEQTGRWYRGRAVLSACNVAYSTGNGVLTAAISRRNLQVGLAFSGRSHISTFGFTLFAEAIWQAESDSPSSVGVRLWMGAGATSWTANNLFVSVEDLGSI